jgi:hypothetical protein
LQPFFLVFIFEINYVDILRLPSKDMWRNILMII